MGRLYSSYLLRRRSANREGVGMIEVYAFEDAEGNSVTDWTTTDPIEAKEFAQENACRWIARIFEYSDSELVESYCPEDDETDRDDEKVTT